MSTILRALRQLQKQREQQDEDTLAGRTSWRPPKRRRFSLLWFCVVVLAVGAVGGTGWLVAVGQSPFALLDDAIQVASSSVGGDEADASAAKPTQRPEAESRAVAPKPPTRPAAKQRSRPAAKQKPAQAKKRKTRERRDAEARAAALAAQAAAPTPEPKEAQVQVAASDEAPPPTPEHAAPEPAKQAPKPTPARKPAAAPKPPPKPAAEPVKKAPTPAPKRAEKPAAPPAPKPAVEKKPAPAPSLAVAARSTKGAAVRAVASDAPKLPDGFPRVNVTRVRWHPEPSRREARVELDQAGPFDAREGDIIAGVMVRRIEPSAVEVSVGGRRALVSVSR